MTFGRHALTGLAAMVSAGVTTLRGEDPGIRFEVIYTREARAQLGRTWRERRRRRGIIQAQLARLADVLEARTRGPSTGVPPVELCPDDHVVVTIPDGDGSAFTVTGPPTVHRRRFVVLQLALEGPPAT